MDITRDEIAANALFGSIRVGPRAGGRTFDKALPAARHRHSPRRTNMANTSVNHAPSTVYHNRVICPSRLPMRRFIWS